MHGSLQVERGEDLATVKRSPQWNIGIALIGEHWRARGAWLRWPGAPWVAAVWMAALSLVTGFPALMDERHSRTELLTRGGLEATWLFENDVLLGIVKVSLLANVLTLLACLCRGPRRQHLALLALIALHGLAYCTVRSLGIGFCYRREQATSNYLEREPNWNNLCRLEIVEQVVPTLHDFSSREIVHSSVQTFPDLHRWVADCYNERRDKLAAELPNADETRRKTIFHMNFVAGLWAFGNKHATDKPGGVLENELNHWQIPGTVTARTFIDSPIGCCGDSAYLLKYLLDQEHIPNRLTALPCHVFNEVELGGKWCIVDATTNLVVDKSWEELYEERDEPNAPRTVVTVFPHPRLADSTAADYRPVVGPFQIQTLLRVASRPDALRAIQHPPQCEIFH